MFAWVELEERESKSIICIYVTFYVLRWLIECKKMNIDVTCIWEIIDVNEVKKK